MPSNTAAMTRASATDARRRSWSLALVSAIVAAQAAVILALGAALAWSALFANPDSRLNAALMGILCLVGGAGLAMCSSALWRRRRWSRAPALVWQLLMIPVGSYQLQSSMRIGGIAVVTTAAIAGVLLLLPRTTKLLAD